MLTGPITFAVSTFLNHFLIQYLMLASVVVASQGETEVNASELSLALKEGLTEYDDFLGTPQ